MKKLTMFFAALAMMATMACASAPKVEETPAEPAVADQPQSDLQFEAEKSQVSEPVVSDSSSSLGAASSGRGH